MEMFNPFAEARIQENLPPVPDVARGVFVQEKIHFTYFARTGTADQWEVRSERIVHNHLTDTSRITYPVFRGRGIAWQQETGVTLEKDFKSRPCPAYIYNQLNACISMITASGRR